MDDELLMFFAKAVSTATEFEIPSLLMYFVEKLVGKGRCSEEILRFAETAMESLIGSEFSGSRLAAEHGMVIVRTLISAAKDSLTFIGCQCCAKTKSCKKTRKSVSELRDLLKGSATQMKGKESVICLIEIAVRFVGRNINATGMDKKEIVICAVEDRVSYDPELVEFTRKVGCGLIDSYVTLGKTHSKVL